MLEERMNRLREHLALIRASFGWTASVLAKKLDVTRQMISSIENKHTKLTVIQYRALRQVFDEEMQRSEEETKVGRDILYAIVDHPDEFTNEERDKILEDARMIVPSIKEDSKTRHATVAKWGMVLAGAIVAAAFSAVFNDKTKGG